MAAPNLGVFNEKKIRADFVSKVYGVLTIQLIITLIIVATCVLQKDVNAHMLHNGLTYFYSAMGLALVLYFILVCIESARRKFPINLLLLFVMTLAFGIMVGSISSYYNANEVLAAVGATGLAVLVVMLLAKFSPFDITTCGCTLCVLSMVNLLVTLILIAVIPYQYAKTTSLILAGFGSFLVCLYLMFDLQLIMGGRTVELSEEEYILAAILLYVDIINLFQYMLILIGGSNRN